MRTHLGASIIGKKCMREAWFHFRWADREFLEGRMLRLFHRGHNEEKVFVDLLRRMGAQVWTHDDAGRQFRVEAFGGHFGGSMDGVAAKLPELDPTIPVLLELKTHNDKWFKALQKQGLIGAFPKHYKQAQAYMHLANLKWCLYCAVNKNDDQLWIHFFSYDPQIGHQLMARAESIIFGQGLPPRISETPAWFECKFCCMREVCFKFKQPRVNCRTCRYSHPQKDGTWSCDLNRPEIKLMPKNGCPHHEFISELC